MGEIIFCKTRHQGKWIKDENGVMKFVGYYASYNDFWNMVKWAGYETIYVDELDPQSDNTYIITPLNDEWLQGWQSPKARIIHYELEWRTDWRASVNEPPGVAETWAADRWLADNIGARYVPLGSDSRLNEAGEKKWISGLDRNYDVALLSYQTHRRQIITRQLVEQELNLAPVSGLWGWERSATLLQSQCMVHVHQNDNTPGIAPLRWCLAAAHKLPLITETINDRGMFGYTHMMQADYNHIAAFTAHMLKDKRLLADYALALHDLLCTQYTFKVGVDSHV